MTNIGIMEVSEPERRNYPMPQRRTLTLTDEQLVFGRDRMLKERLAHWAKEIGAETI